MKVSLNWLKEFVEIPQNITPQQLGEDLTLHVAEVEEVVDQAAGFEHVVVGEIKEIKNHPNADMLKICLVDIGQSEIANHESRITKKNLRQRRISLRPKDSKSENSPDYQLPVTSYQLQIVCGGMNIHEGMKVAVALPGAKIKWHGQGDLVEMKKAKIRGVESNGMICASAEIGLAQSTDKQAEGDRGVMDLKEIMSKPGTPLAEALALSDVIVEIDNKSITNRPDLWGHLGFAREVSAIYSTDFNSQAIYNFQFTIFKQIPNSNNQSAKLGVRIDNSELCPRYLALRMDNIKVTESPDWLQKRLLSIGQRSINNLVDISNYVMFELGQPVHIFDLSKLKTQNSKLKNNENISIIIRKAKQGEKLLTLDKVERNLDEEILVIADEEKPIAIAGVMGGGNSEVDDKTVSIVIEAANFDPISIRKTAQKLGLRTEASARFEKGLDPHLAETAIKRTVQLVQEIIPKATTPSDLADQGEWTGADVKIQTSLRFIQRRLGAEVSAAETASILTRLGFEVSIVHDEMVVLVPSWRPDIKIQEDIVEEVGRIFGYDKLVASLPAGMAKPNEQTNVDLELERKAKNYLTLAAGFQEVENNPFENENMAVALQFTDNDKKIEVANPLSPGERYLRPGLYASLLQNTKDSLPNRDFLRLFELGRVFKNRPGSDFKLSGREPQFLPDQPKRLAGILMDKAKKDQEIFLQLKGVIEGLLQNLRLTYEFRVERHFWLTAGFEFTLLVDKQKAGEFGLISRQALERAKINYPVATFDLYYDLLTKAAKQSPVYVPLPEFPAVARDMAVIVDSQVRYADLDEIVRSTSHKLISAELFDVYEGDQIGANRRSLAWHLLFQDPGKTMTAGEADMELQKIIKALGDKFGAILRA